MGVEQEKKPDELWTWRPTFLSSAARTLQLREHFFYLSSLFLEGIWFIWGPRAFFI
jgi:hypothetical protein